MPQHLVELAFYIMGSFALVLGVLHFGFPRRFGYLVVLSGEEPLPPEFQLLKYRQQLSRKQLMGIVWVMNHASSFTIASIGVFDLCIQWWNGSTAGQIATAWASAFWMLRALCQFFLGNSRADWMIALGFAWLGLVQLSPIMWTPST